MTFMDRISNALEEATDSARTAVLKLLRPEVHEEIDARVKEFQAKSLQELPQTCEAEVNQQSEDNPVAKLIVQAVGNGTTSKLVTKLVEKMRGDIDGATTDLSRLATDLIMEKLNAALDDDDSEDEAETDASSSDRGLAQQKPAVKRSLRHAIKLDGRLGEVERAAREQLHPLFTDLQQKISALVPEKLRESLLEEAFETKDSADAQDERGLMDMLSSKAESLKDWVKETSRPAMEKAVDALIKVTHGPINDVVTKLVNELEETSTDSAFGAVRKQLASYHLLE